MKIKHVKQDNAYGCGIACAASLVNKSYNDIKNHKNKFFPRNDSDFEEVKACLDYHGFKCSKEIEFKSKPDVGESAWKKLKKDALVVIENPKKDYDHFVVFDKFNQRIMDPLTKNFKLISNKKMMSKMRIMYYMYVCKK